MSVRKHFLKRTVLFLAFVTLFSALFITVADAQGTEGTPVPITSIRYYFTVAGAANEGTFLLNVQDANWGSASLSIPATNGEHAVTANFGGVAGFRNLGYVPVIGGSQATLTLDRIVVNGDIVLTSTTTRVLQAGVEGLNGLPHVWQGLANGYVVASNNDESMWLAVVADFDGNGLIRFFESESSVGPQPGPIVTPIVSIQYTFAVEGVTSEPAFAFNVMGDNWAGRNLQIPALNGTHSVTADFGASGVAGMINLGYVTVVPGSNAALTITGLIINREHEVVFPAPRVLTAGSEGINGLPHRWSGLQDGEVIALSEDELVWLAFYGGTELIRLYVTECTAPPPPPPIPPDPEGRVMTTSRSLDYAASMGMGWNLGNTLDSLGGNNLIGWETSWGNPVTTRELINSIADRGFGHIRIPFTIDTRVIDRGANTPANELRFEIIPEWLARYREIVEWADEAGLYVIINIHHDSWRWIGRSINNWDGQTTSWQYRRFRDHWTQLAQLFADMPDTVMFETLNEPHFDNRDHATQNRMIETLNRAAHEIIRGTSGNEQRIILIPSIWNRAYSGNPNYVRPLRNFVYSLNDENLIVTVHYYCIWMFSTNIGVTIFDEPINPAWGTGTPRHEVDTIFRNIYNYFVSLGIGVNIGEWGLLAYDNGHDILQTGEELKYYEYMHYLARRYGVSLTFWDNGSGIDRRSPGLTWRQPRVGAMLEALASSPVRASYSTGLDTLYFRRPVTTDVKIPLTLNGNTFVGIEGLIQGIHYTYNAGVITLLMDYVNEAFAAMGNEYGTFAVLVMTFSGGPDWHQFLVRNGEPEHFFATGTRGGQGIRIPVDFNGNHVRRISASQVRPGGNTVQVGGGQTWFPWLHNGEAFRVHYALGQIQLQSNFFGAGGANVQPGVVTLRVEMFDGQVMVMEIYVYGTGSNAVVRTIVPPRITTFDIFNNGPGGSPSRSNPSLAEAGIIRMWVQLDGVNTPVYLAAADTIKATDQDGNCAENLIRIGRVWQADTGWLDYFNLLDVYKDNGSWRYINLYISVYSQTVHVLLVNANYTPQPPPEFDCDYCQDVGCEICEPTQPTFYLTANHVTVSNTNRHVSVFTGGTAEGQITFNLLEPASELVITVRNNLWTPTGPAEGLVIGVAGNATITESRIVTLEVTRDGVTVLLTIELIL
ncbi:MAG: cellulase family glycosylhydrolase [Firmicutes bacterium]|nr:cellulase family glycosylhydrolase [Bacillota bacterium]